MKRFVFFLIVLSCLAHQASADEVCLKNGNVLEGIITRDTDKLIELEVFLGAKISFTQEDVAYLKRWEEEDNQALRDQWLADREERKKAELARQEFEAGQKDKGLVKYRGKWVEESEKDKLKSQEFVDQVLRSKVERGEILKSGSRVRTEIARALLAKASWRYRQTEHFIIYFEDVLQSKMVADRAEYYYEKIAYDLDYEQSIYWPQKCEVFIVSSEEKWAEYMKQFMQRFDHIGGFVPRTGEKEVYLCAISLPYLSVTFPHELTHLIFREFAQGEDIPLWLNEGLAIYESGVFGYADKLLRDKLKENKHIPVKKIVGLKAYPRTKEEIQLFYAQAEKIVGFLVSQHGRKKFSRLCRLLISGRSFARSLDLVYGAKYYNFDEFNRAWIRYVLK